MAVESSVLLKWYSETARDLPWRREGVSAWQILMS
ncbi:A/G-specific adenine glycosylase, partial [Rhodococcus erythropolis]|nr:A/G-specific adenine glycosylase [Rhodococcus erythropolis]